MDHDDSPASTTAAASPPSRTSASTSGHRTKPVRNQNACDACRSRKVRCIYDSESQPCQGCVFLDINCTRHRPRRKRGPPNRHAQLPELGPGAVAGAASPSPSPSPCSMPGVQLMALASGPSPLSHSSPDISASPSSARTFALDRPPRSGALRRSSTAPRPGTLPPGPWLPSFAPEAVVSRMLTNWFDKVHPVAPILLRRRFLRRLRSGEADVDRTFCGLVVSVCAAVAATLPREDHGPVTVTRCLEFIDENQLITSGFSPSSYSLDWAIAMYNLGTAMGAISDSGLGDMRSYAASSESAAGARYLSYYCMRHLDRVEKQLLKRLFWLLFAGFCSANILGRLPISLLSQELIDAIPRPLDLTDDQMEPPDPLESDHVAWHGDATSYVPGLNCLSDLFKVWHEVQLTPASADPPAARLAKHLSQVQQVIDGLPPELRWRGGLSRPRGVTQGHEVQIANLFITSLHIRSNLLQKLDPTPASLPEHQKIVDDLLEILYHLPQAVFNANGSSVVPKIRDIGAAYLEQVEKGHGAGQADGDGARGKLERVLRKLDDLDCWQGLGVLAVLDNE